MKGTPLIFRAVGLALIWVLVLSPAAGARDVFETPPLIFGLAALLGTATAVLWSLWPVFRKTKRRRRKSPRRQSRNVHISRKGKKKKK